MSCLGSTLGKNVTLGIMEWLFRRSNGRKNLVDPLFLLFWDVHIHESSCILKIFSWYLPMIFSHEIYFLGNIVELLRYYYVWRMFQNPLETARFVVEKITNTFLGQVKLVPHKCCPFGVKLSMNQLNLLLIWWSPPVRSPLDRFLRFSADNLRNSRKLSGNLGT